MIGTPECRKWSESVINQIPYFSKFLEDQYIRENEKAGYVSANNKLRELSEDLGAVDVVFRCNRNVDKYLKKIYERVSRKKGRAVAIERLAKIGEMLSVSGSVGSCSMDDEEIADVAEAFAGACERIVLDAKEGWPSLVEGQEEDFKQKMQAVYIPALHRDLLGFALARNVGYPFKSLDKDTEDETTKKQLSAALRVQDKAWWVRKLKVVYARQTENVLRSLGFVSEGASSYVSEWAFRRWESRQRKNKKMLAEFEVSTEIKGETFTLTLAEAVEQSVANPKCRVAELIARTKGFQFIAETMGYSGMFLTLTAPSKYHSNSKRFNGADPREVNDYFCNVWANIRAEWAKAGIRVFGFRVAEPHADGTPHWHLALNIPEDQKEKAWEIFLRHSLAEDGDELGAKKNRAIRKDMDSDRGSVYSYVMKYITKNLTGDNVDWDHEAGLDGKDSALRVRAWASIWGIRQFQQIGGPSVTVWREFRRECLDLTGMPEVVAKIQLAVSEEKDWAKFCELMGGVFVAREAQTVRPFYKTSKEKNDYGEKSKKIFGLVIAVLAEGFKGFLVSRPFVWTVTKIRRSESEKGARSDPSWNLDNNCNQRGSPPEVGEALRCSYG